MECGCFCCIHTFAVAEAIDRIDDGGTPLFPYCGVATLLSRVTNLVELFRLLDRRFGANAGVPLQDDKM